MDICAQLQAGTGAKSGSRQGTSPVDLLLRPVPRIRASLVGYYFRQLTGGSGPGAELGPFKGQTVGVADRRGSLTFAPAPTKSRSSGSIAVARLFKAFRPRTALRPADRAGILGYA